LNIIRAPAVKFKSTHFITKPLRNFTKFGEVFNLYTMKSLSFVGVILLVIATFLFYLTTDFAVEQIKLSHIMGIMAGVGLGLILGGMVGYVSKGTALKQEQKRREFKQLQKEKLELERKADELAKLKAIEETKIATQNTNPPNY